MSDTLHQVLGPFATDTDSAGLNSLVGRLSAEGFTLPVDNSGLTQPSCCDLYQINEKLKTLDTATKDQLCTYIGHDIDNNQTESYNLNNRENGSQYKIRPKPRQYFCDSYLLDKSRRNNLFFNWTKQGPLTTMDNHAVGISHKAKRRAQAEQQQAKAKATAKATAKAV
jgi:hypothetical protein